MVTCLRRNKKIVSRWRNLPSVLVRRGGAYNGCRFYSPMEEPVRSCLWACGVFSAPLFQWRVRSLIRVSLDGARLTIRKKWTLQHSQEPAVLHNVVPSGATAQISIDMFSFVHGRVRDLLARTQGRTAPSISSFRLPRMFRYPPEVPVLPSLLRAIAGYFRVVCKSLVAESRKPQTCFVSGDAICDYRCSKHSFSLFLLCYIIRL